MASFGKQFSTGDQSHSTRFELWKSGFKTCPKCKKDEIKSQEIGAGCRMNGDGYGTETFTCKPCGWNTSFQYDEASDPYYYETRGWTRTPKKEVAHDWGPSQVGPKDEKNEELQKQWKEDRAKTTEYVKDPATGKCVPKT